MTIEELQARARKVFDYGIAQILEDGQLSQQFQLVGRDGSLELVMADGSVTNDENAKRNLARMLKERVRTHNIVAVIHLSDTYFASNPDPKKDKIRQALGLTIEQGAAAGLCDLHEGVMLSMESPILHMHMQQEYRRDGRKCVLVGEPIIASDADGTMRRALPARFQGFFGDERSA